MSPSWPNMPPRTMPPPAAGRCPWRASWAWPRPIWGWDCWSRKSPTARAAWRRRSSRSSATARLDQGLIRELDYFFDTLADHHIILNDVSARNVVMGQNADGEPGLYLIDGFGSKQAVPLFALQQDAEPPAHPAQIPPPAGQAAGPQPGAAVPGRPQPLNPRGKSAKRREKPERVRSP